MCRVIDGGCGAAARQNGIGHTPDWSAYLGFFHRRGEVRGDQVAEGVLRGRVRIQHGPRVPDGGAAGRDG